MSLDLVRFEQKFLTRKVGREWLSSSLFLRSIAQSFVRSEYEIESLYFDDRDLTFLKQTMSGEKVKHKYRLRRYPLSGDVFWERKSKFSGKTQKTRSPVTGNPSDFIEKVSSESGLRQTCLVRYRRIVWRNPQDGTAFNIDFAISGYNHIDRVPFRRLEPVFEIKFAQPYQGSQLREKLSGEIGLRRVSFSKYLIGMTDGRPY